MPLQHIVETDMNRASYAAKDGQLSIIPKEQIHPWQLLLRYIPDTYCYYFLPLLHGTPCDSWKGTKSTFQIDNLSRISFSRIEIEGGIGNTTIGPSMYPRRRYWRACSRYNAALPRKRGPFQSSLLLQLKEATTHRCRAQRNRGFFSSSPRGRGCSNGALHPKTAGTRR